MILSGSSIRDMTAKRPPMVSHIPSFSILLLSLQPGATGRPTNLGPSYMWHTTQCEHENSAADAMLKTIGKENAPPRSGLCPEGGQATHCVVKQGATPAGRARYKPDDGVVRSPGEHPECKVRP